MTRTVTTTMMTTMVTTTPATTPPLPEEESRLLADVLLGGITGAVVVEVVAVLVVDEPLTDVNKEI